MKRKIILSLACAGLLTGVFAQNQVIKVNPLGLLFGSASLSYEMARWSRSESFQVNANYGILSQDSAKYTSLGASLDLRAYVFSNTKVSPKGLYISPGLSYSKIAIKVDGMESTDITALGLKLVFGHQWIWDNGFAIDLFGGYNYNFYDFQIKYNKYRSLPVVGFAIGYGFGKD